MTRVNVESYDDLDSCQKISSKGADVITGLFAEGIETVVYIPGWMADDTDLNPISGGNTLYVGSVEDYSAKAWKITQFGGKTAFAAKSQAIVFERASDEIKTPQQGLDQYAKGDSR